MKDINYSEETIEKAKALSERCIGCNQCVKECEMLTSFQIKPKEFFEKFAEKQEVEASIPYSCNMCGSCTAVCPKKCNLQEVFMEMREDLIKDNGGKSPMKGHKAIDFHQRFSFSKLFTTSIPDVKAGFTKRVFIPGCSLSSYNPSIVGQTLEFLQEKLPGTGAVLNCCGKPTLSLGQTEKFKERYAELEKAIYDLGAEEVITACQNCFTTLSKYSPKIEVKSLWTVLPEIGLGENMKGKGASSDLVFAIHDACPTRYNAEIQDGIRWLMKEMEYKVEELPNSREKTNCCGFGGMVVPANPNLSLKIMKRGVQEGNTEYRLTYCASCREAMAIAGKPSVHILDLLFGDTYNATSKFNNPPKNPLESWSKRYKTKRKIEKIKNK